MKVHTLFEKFVRNRDGSPDSSCDSMLELIGRIADIKDAEITSLLLNQLVNRYAALVRELEAKQAVLQDDLRAAAEIQRALLPQHSFTGEHTSASWRFIPCERVGGDSLNIFAPTPKTLSFYVLDVSGHGVPSAMIAVSATQALLRVSGVNEHDARIPSPLEVLTVLDNEFPFERFERHFTMNYAVLDESSGRLAYANAGHPPPLLLRGTGEVELLEAGGPIIGLGGMVPFEEGEVLLKQGDRLVLYTDGVTECENPLCEPFGEEGLLSAAKEFRTGSLGFFLDALLNRLHSHCAAVSPRDDISVLALDYHGFATAPGES